MTSPSSAPDPVVGIEPAMPRIYIGCPLTNLEPDRQRSLGTTLDVIKSAVHAVTLGDRASGDEWPVALYVPYEQTAPWKTEGLGALAIYERNYTEVLDSDALIVLADFAASAGVGQEIEWATRAGIPVLYVAPQPPSRQIRGHPALVTYVAYGMDIDTLKAGVTRWLRQSKLRIQAGPLRRHNRALAYTSLTERLTAAWQAAPDPTGAAARCNLQPGFVDSVLAHPARVALLPVETLALVCAELRINQATATRQLSLRATRAWLAAVNAHNWDESTAERLRTLGLAEMRQNPGSDLETPAAWVALHIGRA
jgi:hypothetical protein